MVFRLIFQEIYIDDAQNKMIFYSYKEHYVKISFLYLLNATFCRLTGVIFEDTLEGKCGNINETG